MCETKVAHNDSSYGTNYFYFSEILIMRELGSKTAFFINQSIKKPKLASLNSLSIWRIRQNKK